MQNAQKSSLAKSITITAMMCNGKTLSPDIVDAYITRLARHPENEIAAALHRCQDEVKGHLALRDIIERIEDGHPSPEEAWGMVPTSEDQSVVWTDEIAAASVSVMEMSDRVAARMAFRETYTRLIREARTEGRPIKFFLSAGRDKAGREAAVNKARAMGRLTPGEAMKMLPPPPVETPADRFLPPPAVNGGYKYEEPTMTDEERIAIFAERKKLFAELAKSKGV